jgi:hypothetical protein
MKKILALLMILTVSLSLFACGKADGDGKESTTGNTIAVDKTEDTTAEVTTAEGMKEGDEGNGPADINAEFITLKLPAGYKYKVDSFSKDSKDPLKGNVTLFIYKDGEYSPVAKLTATARNMVRSQEEAVENTIKLCNLQTYKNGKSEIGKDAQYGENTYSTIHVTTENYEKDFFVTYVNRGESDKTGLLVKLEINNKNIKADDPFIKELLDSLKIVMA